MHNFSGFTLAIKPIGTFQFNRETIRKQVIPIFLKKELWKLLSAAHLSGVCARYPRTATSFRLKFLFPIVPAAYCWNWPPANFLVRPEFIREKFLWINGKITVTWSGLTRSAPSQQDTLHEKALHVLRRNILWLPFGTFTRSHEGCSMQGVVVAPVTLHGKYSTATKATLVWHQLQYNSQFAKTTFKKQQALQSYSPLIEKFHFVATPESRLNYSF